MVAAALVLAASLAAAPPLDARPSRGAEAEVAAESRPSPAPQGAAEPARPSARPGLPPAAVLEEVSGTVRSVDRKAHRISVETGSGEVTLGVDRNTMVYTASGLATVLDLREGVPIRAGRNAQFLAYWVQVLQTAPGEPASTPGQGTGPAGGASAPAQEGTGTGGGAIAPPTTAPGGTAPGSSPGPPGR